MSGVSLTQQDFDQAMLIFRHSLSEILGVPKIPSVPWDAVGGLDSVKTEILDTIQLPLNHPELFSQGLNQRSGESLFLGAGIPKVDNEKVCYYSDLPGLGKLCWPKLWRPPAR